MGIDRSRNFKTEKDDSVIFVKQKCALLFNHTSSKIIKKSRKTNHLDTMKKIQKLFKIPISSVMLLRADT